MNSFSRVALTRRDTQQAIYEAENDINLLEIDDLATLKKSLLSDV